MAALTPIQIRSREAAELLKNRSLESYILDPASMGASSLAEAFALRDPDYIKLKEQREEKGTQGIHEARGDLGLKRVVSTYEKLGSPEAMAQHLNNKEVELADQAVKFYDEYPTGVIPPHRSGMSKVLDKVFGPAFMAVMGAAAVATGAGALGALAGGAAGAAGGAAGAAGAGATGAGAAAGTAAGTGVAGSLGLSGLPGSMLNSALSNMAVKAGTNVVTGQNWSDGLLKSGLTGGLGAAATPLTANFVGKGLTNLGVSPDTVKSLIKPITTATVGTGAGLLNGQSLGDAVVGGLKSGVNSYAGDQLSGYIKDMGLGKPATDLLTSAGKGGISSAIKGGNVGQGILGGLTSSAVKTGAGWADNLVQNQLKNFTGGSMSDLFGGDDDIPNWLKEFEAENSQPVSTADMSVFDIGNLFGGDDDMPNWLKEFEKSQEGPISTIDKSVFDSVFDIGNFQIDPAAIAGGLAQATGSSGSSSAAKPGFLESLLKQLGGVGSAAAANPLASLAALVGGIGSVKNAFDGTKGPDMSVVDKLMDKGSAQMNSPVKPLGQIAARDPRLFTQQYDLNNNPLKGQTQIDVANAYRDTLGRAPDIAGMDYWSKSGVNPDQMKQMIMQSPEYTVNEMYKSDLQRPADAAGMEWWKTQLANGVSPDAMRTAIRDSDEFKTNRGGALAMSMGQMKNGGV